MVRATHVHSGQFRVADHEIPAFEAKALTPRQLAPVAGAVRGDQRASPWLQDSAQFSDPSALQGRRQGREDRERIYEVKRLFRVSEGRPNAVDCEMAEGEMLTTPGDEPGFHVAPMDLGGWTGPVSDERPRPQPESSSRCRRASSTPARVSAARMLSAARRPLWRNQTMSGEAATAMRRVNSGIGRPSGAPRRR